MHVDKQHDESQGKAVKLAIPLTPSVYDALRREADFHKRELTEHVQRVLAEHVIRTKSIDADEAERLRLFWSLVDRAVEAAKAICREGQFDSDITLKAIRRCMANPDWIEDYRTYVKDDIYKNGNPLKGPINREIGFRIRAGIGGKVVVGPNGRGATTKVLGAIIQSYTPMESYDPEAVAAA